MYKSIKASLFLIFSVFMVFGQADPPAPLIYKAPQSNELSEFIPSDESFKIIFAGKPDMTEELLSNDVLIKVYNTYKYGSRSSVTTLDFPFLINKEDVFKRYKEEVVKSPDGKLVNDKIFTQGGSEGVEFEVSHGIQYSKIKVFLFENRVYELQNTVTNWHILSDSKKKEFFDETSRFFDSFNFIVSQTENVKDSSDFWGELNNDTYNNKFFGFSFKSPKDWNYKSKEEIKKTIEKGLELYKTDNEKNNKELLDSTKQEIPIFSAVSITKDRNFGIGVTKQISRFVIPKLITKQTKEIFLGNENVKLVDDIKEININGINYSTFAILSFDRIKTRVYLTVKKGYSISFVLTFVNSEGENELNEIMQSVKFDKK